MSNIQDDIGHINPGDVEIAVPTTPIVSRDFIDRHLSFQISRDFINDFVFFRPATDLVADEYDAFIKGKIVAPVDGQPTVFVDITSPDIIVYPWPGQLLTDYDLKPNIIMAALLVEGYYYLMMTGDRKYRKESLATCEICGPPSFELPVTACLTLWLDAADLNTLTINNDAQGDRVSQWDDKSGLDHHFVQTTEELRPITNFNLIGTLNTISSLNGNHTLNSIDPTIDFWDDGTGDLKYTIFIVAKLGDTATNAQLFGDLQSGTGIYLQTPFSDIVDIRGRQFDGVTWIALELSNRPDDVPYIIRQGWDGTDLHIQAPDDELEITGPVGAPVQLSTLNLFLLGAFPCDVGEIIIFCRYLSQTEIDLMVAYLKGKWQI